MSDLDMIKMEINGKMYDVVPNIGLYQNNSEAYLPNYTASLSKDGKYVLPLLKKNETGPGIYATGLMSREYLPPEEDKEKYSINNAVNLSDAKNIGELLQKQTAIREIEQDILTDADNIFTPKIGPNDSPEIKALKEAVIKKHIDIDKYEPRFGSNYSNDKRLFFKDRMSLPMLQRVCGALDIKATLTLEDQNEDVPNPINDVIQVELTKGEETE